MRILLKDGKFAGYEPQKDIIKKTQERKGKNITDTDIEKLYQKRLKEFDEMPNKGQSFVIKENKK